ncbi:hypothetical protein ASE72_04285 [Sphingomonas sp. Leaf20]|nr:hypothetical protein ASE72_04285 [Sphingomonas sp. Leaf20]
MQHGFTRGRGEGAGSYRVGPVAFAHGRRPTFAVILTEVRIQSCGRWRLGLWILTFVRMTGVFAGRGAGRGFAARPHGCLVRGGCPTLVVILTEVGIQGCGRGRLGLWILTFVRMTGGLDGRAAGRGFAARPLGCLVRGGCPTPVVILSEVRIQGCGRWGLGLWILTFVRMTGVWMVGLRGLDSRRGRLGCLVRGGRPMLAVILTEVRIQGYGWGRLRLWVLTFVRMTGVLLVGVRGVGSQRGRMGSWPAAAAPCLPSS